MAFNKNINGIRNELQFVKYLNKRKVNELNPMFEALISTLFQNIKESDEIICSKIEGDSKGDIIIRIDREYKIISIKKGIKNSVHLETLENFISFLKYYRVEEEIINKYLKYHYADGTIDGSGANRITVAEYKESHQDEIDKINEKINSKFLLHRAAYRFVFKGIQHHKEIDALIFGVVEDFIWATRDELETIILSKINEYSTGVHMGPLSIQPWNRCINKNTKYEKCRHYVQVKWYNLADDIILIMNNYRKN